MIKYFLVIVGLILVSFLSYDSFAQNANLFVTVEDQDVTNFSGAQIGQVVIVDPDLNDTDEPKGEPDVSINGHILRMVQATDGKWYGYFADRKHAQIYDTPENNFGTFCDNDTVLPPNQYSQFTDTVGFAINGDVTRGVKGTFTIEGIVCTTVSPQLFSNVVNNPPQVNTHPSIPPGQIDIDVDAWPIIQLYNFNPTGSVVVQYNKGGGAQSTTLAYDAIPQDEIPSNHPVIIPHGTDLVGCQETNECYLPRKISIEYGDTITWRNIDSKTHTVTSGNPGIGGDGFFDSGYISVGKFFSMTFEEDKVASPGLYQNEIPYLCLIHPWATGIIFIEEAKQSQSSTDDNEDIIPPGSPDPLPASINEIIIPPESAEPGCEVTDSCFVPSSKTIHVGQTITWLNNHLRDFHLSSGTPSMGPDGIFENMMEAGESFSHTFPQVGTFPFFGMSHPWMEGEIIVVGIPSTVLDNIPPLLIIPEDISVQAESSNGGAVEYSVKAIDDIDGVLSPTCKPASGSIFPIGETRVLCEVKDSSGNLAREILKVTVTPSEFLMPDWIKEVGGFWCNDEIDDDGFIQAIQYLIENDIVIVHVSESGSGSAEEIPSWIKNNACWWNQGLISDGDFVQGIQYLIKEGIIKI